MCVCELCIEGRGLLCRGCLCALCLIVCGMCAVGGVRKWGLLGCGSEGVVHGLLGGYCLVCVVVSLL